MINKGYINAINLFSAEDKDTYWVYYQLNKIDDDINILALSGIHSFILPWDRTATPERKALMQRILEDAGLTCTVCDSDITIHW